MVATEINKLRNRRQSEQRRRFNLRQPGLDEQDLSELAHLNDIINREASEAVPSKGASPERQDIIIDLRVKPPRPMTGVPRRVNAFKNAT